MTFLAVSLPKLQPFPSCFIPRPLQANLILSAFLINLTVPKKQLFTLELLLGLLGQVFNS